MPGSEISSEVVRQAVQWMVELHSGEMTEEQHAVFARWRAAHESHERACQRIENSLGRVPDVAGQKLLRDTLITGGNRREFLRTALTIAAVGSVGGWVYNRYTPVTGLFADYHTATSERRTERLRDGTMLTLNARTGINIEFNEDSRNISLMSGQIYIDSPPASSPVVVTTGDGSLSFYGGKFTASIRDGVTRFAALNQSGRVKSPRSILYKLKAGGGVFVNGEGLSPFLISSNSETAWTNGFFEINDQPLNILIDALRDYRSGIIRLSPEAAKLRVSGIFPLDNSDYALESLAQTLPIVMTRTTGYWVSISTV